MKRFTGGGALRPLIASIGVYALMGLVTPAAAAEAASTSVAADDGNTIEPIIVTARRRSESIQTTPLSVTAISPTQLQAAAAPDIRDLAGRAPSLVIDQVNAGPSAAAISIRGISFEDIEKSFDPAVGVLIDDVYIGTNTGQLTDAFDLQSVQVLRGPQGTLFGRNTIGG
ncbi:Plug domain-containing protein, partial [Phenylobacterium aquaticum]